MDFAVSLIPGWHTTIFPPYFVAGAIFSGFAMVLTLMVICRKAFALEHIVTLRHFDYMAKIMLVTGTMVGYAYAMEFFTAWYSGNPYEIFTFLNRAGGPYAWAYWIMVSCNVISPQIFWFKKARTSIPILFVVSIVINIGMWFERFVIIVTSLHRDFLPSSWGYFSPTLWDVLCLLGSFGLFFTMFCLFVRFPADGGHRRGEDRAAAGRSALAADGHGPEHADTEQRIVERPWRPRPRSTTAPAPDGASRCRCSRGCPTGRTSESWPSSPRRRSCITRASGCATRASPGGTPTARSRSTAWTRRWGSGAPGFPGSSWSWGSPGPRSGSSCSGGSTPAPTPS